MPLNVSKNCFPAPSICQNCLRKRTNRVKKESDSNKEYKRCGNCHVMTYCDKDCQREHWIKVHKKHCRFLSGKAPVNNSKHNPATCPRCIDQNQRSPTQLRSENSPKTICLVEEVIVAMKTILGDAFKFHGDGKTCNCALEFACELPFQLGEVSGQYVEIANTGLDIMLAHALNITTAMGIKARKEDHKDALKQLWSDIVTERTLLWYFILQGGVPITRPIGDLSEKVDSLQTIYGVSNPWWKTLKYSVDFVVKTSKELLSKFMDSHSLGDSRFQNLKLVHDYKQSQLQKQSIVCEKQIWANFMLWPGLANGSLAVLLPPGSRCHSCYAQLTGQVTISTQEFNSKTLPWISKDVGDDGALMACCPFVKNPNCRLDCLFKNVTGQIRVNDDQWKKYEEERDLFSIESRECDFCLKSSLSSHRCSSCRSVQYCSTLCQKKDLEFHNSVCSTWAEDKSRRILDRGKQKDYFKSYLGDQ